MQSKNVEFLEEITLKLNNKTSLHSISQFDAHKHTIKMVEIEK